MSNIFYGYKSKSFSRLNKFLTKYIIKSNIKLYFCSSRAYYKYADWCNLPYHTSVLFFKYEDCTFIVLDQESICRLNNYAIVIKRYLLYAFKQCQ